ncbi:metallophosphoesterase family protein [Echinicola sediminis]
MPLFIIGDIHGCYHTLLKLLEHWNPEKEQLIQVGDLIDRGNYSAEVLQWAMETEEKHPDNTFFLKGNHEQMMQDYIENGKTGGSWFFNGGRETYQQFSEKNIALETLSPWLQSLPLKWESNRVLVSHAGISETLTPMDVTNPDGILWNRKPLKKLPQTQVIGHTPQQNGKARFTKSSKSWNIDTGAYRGICLTALKLGDEGQFLEEINIPTDTRDFLI